MTVVLDLCVITHLDPPTTPVSTAYTMFALADLTIDLSSPGFQQVPACGYYLVEEFTWTIPTGAPIVANTSSGSNYIIDVSSTTPAHDSTYSVTLTLKGLYATLVTEYT